MGAILKLALKDLEYYLKENKTHSLNLCHFLSDFISHAHSRFTIKEY